MVIWKETPEHQLPYDDSLPLLPTAQPGGHDPARPSLPFFPRTFQIVLHRTAGAHFGDAERCKETLRARAEARGCNERRWRGPGVGGWGRAEELGDEGLGLEGRRRSVGRGREHLSWCRKRDGLYLEVDGECYRLCDVRVSDTW